MPPMDTVRAAEAVLQLERLARGKRVTPAVNRLRQILGMYESRPSPVLDLVERKAGECSPLLIEVIDVAVGPRREDHLRHRLGQKAEALRALARRVFSPFAIADIADVALDDVLTINVVGIADELHFGTASVAGFERQILIADVAVPLQPLERGFALLDVAEQTDLPKVLADQVRERIAEELDDERIGVDDRAAVAVENQDCVLRRLEQPAIAGLGSPECKRRGVPRNLGGKYGHDAAKATDASLCCLCKKEHVLYTGFARLPVDDTREPRRRSR